MLGGRGTSLLAANGVIPRSSPPFQVLSCPAPWSPGGPVGAAVQAVPPPARCTPYSGASASSHPFFVCFTSHSWGRRLSSSCPQRSGEYEKTSPRVFQGIWFPLSWCQWQWVQGEPLLCSVGEHTPRIPGQRGAIAPGTAGNL